MFLEFHQNSFFKKVNLVPKQKHIKLAYKIFKQTNLERFQRTKEEMLALRTMGTAMLPKFFQKLYKCWLKSKNLISDSLWVKY